MRARTLSRNFLWLGLCLVAGLSAPGCGKRNVAKFSGTPRPPASGIMMVTRAETADQGSGTSEQPDPNPGMRVKRLTVGGYYLRRNDSTSPNNNINAGIHGNPTATE